MPEPRARVVSLPTHTRRGEEGGEVLERQHVSHASINLIE